MLKNFKFQISNFKAGFTLLELIIVMTIIGVLATFAANAIPSAMRRARDTQRINDIRNYQIALDVYANKNEGYYPDTSGDAHIDPAFCSNLGLSSCPEDPATSEPYSVNSISTAYHIWAQLEQPQGSSTTFTAACSGGLSGTDGRPQSGSACPFPTPTPTPTPGPTSGPSTPTPTLAPTSIPTQSLTSTPTPTTVPCVADGLECRGDIDCCSGDCNNSICGSTVPVGCQPPQTDPHWVENPPLSGNCVEVSGCGYNDQFCL